MSIEKRNEIFLNSFQTQLKKHLSILRLKEKTDFLFWLIEDLKSLEHNYRMESLYHSTLKDINHYS